MTLDEEDEHIDCSHWLPRDVPLITKERAEKGDVITGEPCGDCGMTGRDKDTRLTCSACKGKGWLSIVNAEHVEIDKIRFAQIQVRSILNYLWEEEIVEDQQHHDGMTFQIWRDMHQTSMGMRKPVTILGEEEKAIGVRMRAYGYVLLLRRLSCADVRAITQAIDGFANYHTQEIALRSRNAYRVAFFRLSKAMQPIRDQIAYLEGLTDEQRAALSEERLKNLLQRV